ncbi:glycoside hydrolase family 3 protein, partial [Streptomyces himastatinicus]|uniref:glycoside hydrolase family 3 protein n=1 Tax=Streptomyces himastatinicus TaxID=998084 RepID=UPI0001B4DEAF
MPANPAAPDARELLGRLTLAEKVKLLTGRDFWSTWPLEKIGLRSILMSDGPSGVRGPVWDEREPSLNLPSATALSASWDDALAYRYGAVIAQEARGKGVDVALGPTINLHRSPLGGRHFEAFSEDPLLTGHLAAAYVRGIQDNGVAATPKHYIANDYETDRFTASTEVSERTLREVYLLPFEKAVTEARAWAVMSAYNAVNGVTATENDLLETPLNSEWGFDGVVISDWTAVRSTHAARAAQDLEMPGPRGAWGDALLAAVESGAVDEADIDRKVLRILILAARVGALEGTKAVEPTTADSGAGFAREAAAEGMVLVRNTGGVLPLDPGAVTRIAVIGHNADRARTQGGGSATVVPEEVVSPLDGIRAAFPDAEVEYALGAVVQEGIAELPLDALTNPATGEPGLRVRFLSD